jgi:hypothetical protein
MMRRRAAAAVDVQRWRRREVEEPRVSQTVTFVCTHVTHCYRRCRLDVFVLAEVLEPFLGSGFEW